MNTLIDKNNNGSLEINPPRAFAGSVFRAAFERRLPEIVTVKEEDFAALTLDGHSAVTTVRGVLPQILAFRDDMRKLAFLDQKLVDSLEDYAFAAAEACARYDVATTPQEDIVALNDEAVALRERLRADALVLVGRGLVDRARLSKLTGEVGYKNVAFELLDYVQILGDAWPTIQGKSAVTVEELEHAQQLAERITLVVGLRERAPAMKAEAAKVRGQALTLLVNAYDEVRRALTFINWQQDNVEAIAPTLYAASGRGRRKAEDKPAADAPAAPVAAQPPTGAALRGPYTSVNELHHVLHLRVPRALRDGRSRDLRVGLDARHV